MSERGVDRSGICRGLMGPQQPATGPAAERHVAWGMFRAACDETRGDGPEHAATTLREVLGLNDAEALGHGAIQGLLRWGAFTLEVTPELQSDVGGAEAMLIPLRDDAFCILVDPRPLGGWRPMPEKERRALERRRLRFRIAHEIGHSLFYTRAPGQEPQRRSPVTDTEERFCDEFAAALLLPPSVVAEAQLTTAALYALADDFDVSMQVVARSVMRYHSGTASVSLVVHSDSGPRVQWSSHESAARAAFEEASGSREAHEIVEWGRSGRQSLRLERRLAAAR